MPASKLELIRYLESCDLVLILDFGDTFPSPRAVYIDTGVWVWMVVRYTYTGCWQSIAGCWGLTAVNLTPMF